MIDLRVYTKDLDSTLPFKATGRMVVPDYWGIGEGGGKEVQEEGDLGIPMADSCWCLAETNTKL